MMFVSKPQYRKGLRQASPILSPSDLLFLLSLLYHVLMRVIQNLHKPQLYWNIASVQNISSSPFNRFLFPFPSQGIKAAVLHSRTGE